MKTSRCDHPPPSGFQHKGAFTKLGVLAKVALWFRNHFVLIGLQENWWENLEFEWEADPKSISSMLVLLCNHVATLICSTKIIPHTSALLTEGRIAIINFALQLVHAGHFFPS